MDGAGLGPDLAPAGHPSGAGQTRAPRQGHALNLSFSLSFGLPRAILHVQQTPRRPHRAFVALCCDSHWLMGAKNGSKQAENRPKRPRNSHKSRKLATPEAWWAKNGHSDASERRPYLSIVICGCGRDRSPSGPLSSRSRVASGGEIGDVIPSLACPP